MKQVRVLSFALGLSSLAFGTLKFMDPFRQWYSVQIVSSGLPSVAFPLGIAAEIITGLMFLLLFLPGLSIRNQFRLLTLANISLILVMVVATVVHLNPEVPAEVLPLKIKPPVIPLLFVAAAVFNQRMLSRKPATSGAPPTYKSEIL